VGEAGALDGELFGGEVHWYPWSGVRETPTGVIEKEGLWESPCCWLSW
jgi:hypothetical protein